MYSPATTVPTTPATTPYITPATTPATSDHQHEHKDTPDCPPTRPVSISIVQDGPRLTRHVQPVLTNDFYLDTHFNPVWMSGPNVFSFAQDGTVVRPETYAPEPYPGYHADRHRAQRLESANASHFHGFVTKDPKPWKNVAITEQDDAEFAAFQARMRTGAGEWRPHPPYGHAQRAMPEEPELVYTWPPKPYGR